MKFPETSKRINEILYETGLTPQELADKSGINKASISQYRNGSHKPSNTSAEKISTITKINPLWIMGYEVPKYTNGKPVWIENNEDLIYIHTFLTTANKTKIRQLRKYAELILEGEEE